MKTSHLLSIDEHDFTMRPAFAGKAAPPGESGLGGWVGDGGGFHHHRRCRHVSPRLSLAAGIKLAAGSHFIKPDCRTSRLAGCQPLSLGGREEWKRSEGRGGEGGGAVGGERETSAGRPGR